MTEYQAWEILLLNGPENAKTTLNCITQDSGNLHLYMGMVLPKIRHSLSSADVTQSPLELELESTLV